MKEVITTLNAVEMLGKYLKESGYNQVKVVPSSQIDNESDICHIYVSYKHYDRFEKLLKGLLIYTETK